MKKLEDLAKNNPLVDHKIIDDINKFKKDFPTFDNQSKPSFINHPLDSEIFRQAMKASNIHDKMHF